MLKKYKEIKMAEVPDMWEDIERKLAPKAAQEKVKFPTRRLSFIAAIVAAVLLLGPVITVIQKSALMEKKDVSGVEENNAGRPSHESKPSYDVEKDNAEEGSKPWHDIDKNDSDGIDKSDGEMKNENAPLPERFELIASILEVRKTEGGFVIQIQVEEGVTAAEEGASSAEEILGISDLKGCKLEITYIADEKGYEAEDFAGTLKLVLQKEGKNIRLMEILP